MARNSTPRAKRSRRLGEKIFLHGEKAYSRRPYPPGQHGPKGALRTSEYGLRLREKQKAQATYGILERQFRRYFHQAKRTVGDTGEILLQLFESRLDNVVFRAGFAPSREAARQLVRHGTVTVDGKRVDIPSFPVRVGQTVTIDQRRQAQTRFQSLAKQLEQTKPAPWLEVNPGQLSARLATSPSREEIAVNINPQLIVEFYSR